jgi:hypothetical protein
LGFGRFHAGTIPDGVAARKSKSKSKSRIKSKSMSMSVMIPGVLLHRNGTPEKAGVRDPFAHVCISATEPDAKARVLSVL